MAEDDSSVAFAADLDIRTEDEILNVGLTLLGWSEKQIRRPKEDECNLDRYSSMFGMQPHVMAQLWEDLQTTTIEAAKLGDPSEKQLLKLHWGTHFLYRYPTGKESMNIWNKCENNVRDSTWDFVIKIQALKPAKIVWPLPTHANDIWMVSVDGTHLQTQEPGDSEIPKDPSYFSFKHHCAGFNYEVGLSLYESKCIWLSGPHKAGEYNDAKMFREKGLREKLRQYGWKAIGDDGYKGFPNQMSIANGLDSEPVSVFKVRSRQRHEAYNGKLKVFAVLSEKFRHPRDKLQMCFEAVSVLVEYKMELGEPLFDI